MENNSVLTLKLQKQTKTIGLIDRGTRKVALKMTYQCNHSKYSFFLHIKNLKTSTSICKTQIVLQGRKNKDKALLVHDLTN